MNSKKQNGTALLDQLSKVEEQAGKGTGLLFTEEAQQYFDQLGGKDHFTPDSVRAYAKGATLTLAQVQEILVVDESIAEGTKCARCSKVVESPVKAAIILQDGTLLTKEKYVDASNPKGLVWRGQAAPKFQGNGSIEVEVGHKGRCLEVIRSLGPNRKPLYAQSGYQATMRMEELQGERNVDKAYQLRHQRPQSQVFDGPQSGPNQMQRAFENRGGQGQQRNGGNNRGQQGNRDRNWR